MSAEPTYAENADAEQQAAAVASLAPNPDLVVQPPSFQQLAAEHAKLHNVTDPHAGHHHLSQRDANFVMWTTILMLVGAQIGLTQFKKRYPKQYNFTTLLGLWLVPCGFGLVNSWIQFLVVWALFSMIAAFFLMLARSKPIAKDTPRKVYLWLDVTYRACMAGTGAAWFCFMMILICPPVLGILPKFVVKLLISVGTYSVYFGVLIRDIGEYAADTMAANLAYKRGKGDDDDDSATAARMPKNTCALCSDELRIVGEGTAVEEHSEEGGFQMTEITRPMLMRAPDGSLVVVYPGTPVAQQIEAAVQASRRRAAAARADDPQNEEQKILQFPGHDGKPLFQLQCKHVFHENCIKGWCVVGKKNVCPCCSERVDMKVLLKTSPLWGTSSLAWGRLLDVVRYLVVWNPLVFLVLRLVFYEAGVGAG